MSAAMHRLILCLPVVFALPALATAQPKPAIDALVRQTMKQWQVPGLALVIVRDDRLLYLQGYGTRVAGTDGPVTADTVFPIASCTKSFTTLAMAMLVDDDRLGWDDPVRKHLPYFHLADPLADASVTLRDLVTHRTGIGGHDLLWYGSGWSLDERIKHACKLDPAVPFRSGFRYQVMMFGAAGVAAGNAAGISWQDLVTRRILEPLGMTSSRCIYPGDDTKDLAQPHRKDADGKVHAMPRFPIREPDPAGSIHSTARDLAPYLRFQLGDGAWQGKRLISAASLAEPQTAQVVLRLHGAARTMNPETLFLNCGMGWIVQDYRGKKLVMHGGAIDGFRSHLTLVPEARLGIGLLSNLDGGLSNLAISNSLIDMLLGLPTRDWSSYYLELFEESEREGRARAKDLRDHRSSEGPPRPLTVYAGSYEDAAYGPCKIEVADGKLLWNWGKVRCPLEHYQGDAFLGNHGPLVDTGFAFTADPSGAITSFRMMDRVFRRKS
jgi:CubicO group peptidase (beta-lactamase class C family)